MKRSKQIQAKFDSVVSAVLEALEGRVLLSAANSELSLGVITNSTPEPPPGYEARGGDAVSEGLLSAGISKVLYGVPEYFWYGGCSPTSGGMVMGYWDKLAYPNFFPGDASTQTTEVNDSIASPEYITDWKPKPDPAGPKHTDNCIADFMGTSRGDLNWGWTYLDNLDNGMEDYAAYKGYNYADAVNVGWGSLSFASIQAEINADRPFIINVDSDGSGEPDHSMACIGYRTSPSNQYAAYTTWSGMSGIQWFDWRDVSAGDDFGVHSVTFFRPSASRPDLAPSFANVVQEPLTWGDSFNYDYTVVNYGGQNAGASTVKFYLSTNSTITAASDYLLGSVAVPAIDAYSRSSGSPLLSLPNSPPTGFPTSGTLYIGMIVDANGVIAEGSENNNSNLGEFVSYDSLAVSTKADLVGKALTLDMPILNFGSTTASFSIMNQGQTNAGSFTVQFYLSQNSAITTSDTLIGTRVVSSLAKGSTYQSTISLTVPKTDPFGGNGQYTIGMIIDALDTVNEGDEVNNSNRGLGIDRAAAQYGVKVFNATFDNGDGAMNIENDTVWAPEDGLWHITNRRASDLGHGGATACTMGRIDWGTMTSATRRVSS